MSLLKQVNSKITTRPKEVSKQHQYRSQKMLIAKSEDIRELVKLCGDSSALLFSYYLRHGNQKDFEFTDKKAAQALGWSISKAKKTRLKLKNAGWYAQDKFSSPSTGNKIVTDYLGKQTVAEFKLTTTLNKIKMFTEHELRGMLTASGLFNDDGIDKMIINFKKSGRVKQP